MPSDPWDDKAPDPWDEPAKVEPVSRETLEPNVLLTESAEPGRQRPVIVNEEKARQVSFGNSMLGGHAVPQFIRAMRDTIHGPSYGGPIAAANPVASKWNDLLTRYGAYRENARRDVSDAAKFFPGAALEGSVMGAVTQGAGTGIVGAALGAPAAAATSALGRTAARVGENAAISAAYRSADMKPGEDFGDVAGGVAKDVMFGEGARLMARAAIHPVIGVAKGMSGARNITESAEIALGGTKLGQKLGSNGAPIPENNSPAVTALRTAINAAEDGKAAAEAAEAGIRDMGGLAGKRVSALAPSEIREVAETMTVLEKTRGAQAADATHHVANWDNYVRSYGVDGQTKSVADLVRAVNKHNLAHVAADVEHVAERYEGMGIASNMVEPAKKMVEGAKSSRSQYLVGEASNTLEPIEQWAERGKYQFGKSQLPPQRQVAPFDPNNSFDVTADKMARGGADLNAPGGWSVDPSQHGEAMHNIVRTANEDALNRNRVGELAQFDEPFAEMKLRGQDAIATPAGIGGGRAAPNASGTGLTRENMLPVSAEAQQNYESTRGPTTQMANQMRSDDVGMVIQRARELQGVIEAAKKNAENEQLQAAARDALAKLEGMTTGRAALDKILRIGGALTGVASGGGAMSVLTGGGGGFLGMGVLPTIEAAGRLGDRLQSSPQWNMIEKMAGRDDGIGRMAQWVLSGGPDAAARAMVFFRRPEVQEESARSQQ